MKIATWNIERPNESSGLRNEKILDAIKRVDADILVLTETNSCIDPGTNYTGFTTQFLPLNNPPYYKQGENRTTIWSKYPAAKSLDTFDDYTAICVKVNTPYGDLFVYGSIIGVYGNRELSFKNDLDRQIADWSLICARGPICIVGDFNISFGDNYYFTHEGRDKLNKFFEDYSLTNTTSQIPENIDHIVISKSFLQSYNFEISIWNENKELSDHKGVCVTITQG